LISEPTFSFYITSPEEQLDVPSYLHFGKPEQFPIAETTIEVFEDFFWSADWESVAFNDERNIYGFEHDLPIYSIFDSGTTHLVFPDTYYKSFVIKLMEVADVVEFETGQVITYECKDTFPTLFFNFQSKWLEVLPEDYIIKGNDGKCTLLITGNSVPFAVFGLPLFSGYYTSHYMSEGKIGFTPHDKSRKSDISKNTIPTTQPKDALAK